MFFIPWRTHSLHRKAADVLGSVCRDAKDATRAFVLTQPQTILGTEQSTYAFSVCMTVIPLHTHTRYVMVYVFLEVNLVKYWFRSLLLASFVPQGIR